jgi:hypothetical protein
MCTEGHNACDASGDGQCSTGATYSSISGQGTKCATESGDDPDYQYLTNKSSFQCKSECDRLRSECYGYTIGNDDGCILWKEKLSLTDTQQDSSFHGCFVRIICRATFTALAGEKTCSCGLTAMCTEGHNACDASGNGRCSTSTPSTQYL